MKRTMSRIAAIVAIVFSGLMILGALSILGIGIAWMASPWSWGHGAIGGGVFLFIIGIILLVLSVAQIIIGTNLIKMTNDPSAHTSTFNGTIIALLVLSFFGGTWISIVLAIIALCMENEEGAPIAQSSATISPWDKSTPSKTNNFDEAITRLKQYKADGIIDETMFKQKMEELFKKHYMD